MNKETAPYDALIDIGKKRRDAEWLAAIEEMLENDPSTYTDNSSYALGVDHGYSRALEELKTRLEAK